MTTQLCPAQQQAFDALAAALPHGQLFVLRGQTGMGRTTVLRELQRTLGSAYLTMREFVEALRPCHPLALEETFQQWVLHALTEHDSVIVDDLYLLYNVAEGGCGGYPRHGFLSATLMTLAQHVAQHRKKLLVGFHGEYTPWILDSYGATHAIPDYQPADYEFLCRAYLRPDRAGLLDFAKIHRFAPRLNAHQLKGAAVWLRDDAELTTERFIDYLRSRQLTSNVDLNEVRPVTLRDLKGVDDVIESLEANIVLPLENDELATELQLKPKRGVLLVGPPGTGKTTVGRALAHRLKSKFFLVDGTFISGTNGFYNGILHLFETAKQNAPSILFIDDSDAIFEGGEELGFYRYLLTMLDGLESASAGRVCVMMTAMDVSHLPPALIRSGRIELWLEMRLPEAPARAAILEQCVAPLPEALRATVDLPEVVTATQGFTGADLRRLVEDGKNLYAYDKARGCPLQPLTDYLLTAVQSLRADKERYAEAETHARQQRPSRPVYFNAPVPY